MSLFASWLAIPPPDAAIEIAPESVSAAVVSALRSVLDQLGVRPRRVAFVIPDLAARVSLVRFDRIPERREDLEQLVRWQMKKSAPFPIDDALVSFSVAARTPDGGAEY